MRKQKYLQLMQCRLLTDHKTELLQKAEILGELRKGEAEISPPSANVLFPKPFSM